MSCREHLMQLVFPPNSSVLHWPPFQCKGQWKGAQFDGKPQYDHYTRPFQITPHRPQAFQQFSYFRLIGTIYWYRLCGETDDVMATPFLFFLLNRKVNLKILSNSSGLERPQAFLPNASSVLSLDVPHKFESTEIKIYIWHDTMYEN